MGKENIFQGNDIIVIIAITVSFNKYLIYMKIIAFNEMESVSNHKFVTKKVTVKKHKLNNKLNSFEKWNEKSSIEIFNSIEII